MPAFDPGVLSPRTYVTSALADTGPTLWGVNGWDGPTGKAGICGAPCPPHPLCLLSQGERRNSSKHLVREGGVGEGEEGADGPRATEAEGGPGGAGCGTPGEASGEQSPKRAQVQSHRQRIVATRGRPLRPPVSIVNSGLSPLFLPLSTDTSAKNPLLPREQTGVVLLPGLALPPLSGAQNDRVLITSRGHATTPFPENPLPSPREQGRLCRGPL